MCHLTEMKHNTIQFFSFHTIDITNTSLNNVNDTFKIMDITTFKNKLTTHLYICRKCDIVHNTMGSVEQFIVVVKHL